MNDNPRVTLKTILIFYFLFIPSAFLFAQDSYLFLNKSLFPYNRDIDINRALDETEGRNKAIENTIRQKAIELTFEYIFSLQGQQTFEIIDSQGRRISRLHYLYRGQMPVFKGEVRLSPEFSIGARYADSNLKRTTCTDTDWLPPVTSIWWESHSRNKAEVQFYDINFYFRLFDYNKESLKQTPSAGRELLDLLKIQKADRLFLDLLTGYQWQNGRFGTSELVDTMEWWVPTDTPYAGLDSYYKIKYDGPRIGLRGEGDFGKFNSKLSIAYALLRTKAYGWWNLQGYSFEQNGNNGLGLDIGLETTYKFNERFSAGLGYNYLLLRQRKLKESGNKPGVVYDEEDIVRNAQSEMSGPSFILKFLW